jgi:hypothetical protein
VCSISESVGEGHWDRIIRPGERERMLTSESFSDSDSRLSPSISISEIRVSSASTSSVSSSLSSHSGVAGLTSAASRI